jgi:hypothetical protein
MRRRWLAIAPLVTLPNSELFAKGGGLMYKRILVPSDGSVPAVQDVKAMFTKAEIIFLGVLVNSAPEHSFSNSSLVPWLLDSRDTGREALSQGGIERYRNLLLMCESSIAEPLWRSQTRR